MNTVQRFAIVVAISATTLGPGAFEAFASNPEKPAGQEHIVEITGFRFVPETIEPNPGDTITWVNRDIAPHTATSSDGSWDTGTLNQNESKTLKVRKNMTSEYLCRFHPQMTAKVAIGNRTSSGE